VTTQECIGCEIPKPLSDFYRNPNTNYYYTRCLDCARAYRRANKEKLNAQSAEWYRNNKERRLKLSKAWYEANKDKKKKSCRAWQAANSSRYKALVAEWDKQNPKRRKEISLKWRKENPEAWRALSLRKKYGLTVEQFDDMVKAQGGLCAICLKPETRTTKGQNRYLSVDHDHNTNKIRGLLCHRCNASLGLMREDLDSLRRMIDYIINEGV
jgi:hypothetical protein